MGVTTRSNIYGGRGGREKMIKITLIKQIREREVDSTS